MKTLHLNLLRHWFDMVRNGIKEEEYREITPYWCSRLLLYEGIHCSNDWWAWNVFHGDIIQKLQKGFDKGLFTFKPFDTITFSNGYSKTRDQFEIEKLNINIDTGNPDWGATKGKRYFVLTLGKIIKPIVPCQTSN
ncbi:hypothetical protein KDU71_07570 [Carboxylicivirga sediminis]|uniref:Uncharacterized protein n=1 Tax=Carboxylicivirga sediminis TaxID=2006564 RepID=A0A941F553_9BACT|nr:hypothetical protein [Carboxylicivirga sediminis]MBR8535415.1 hypothetical protein [Carboxylicivirga sediminis]